MNVLELFEADGYRFRLDGDQVRVGGPSHLLGPLAMAELRKHREALREALLVRQFANAVRNVAVWEFERYVDPAKVADELDEADRAALRHCDRDERTAWAWLLAWRLTRGENATTGPAERTGALRQGEPRAGAGGDVEKHGSG